MDFGLEKVSWVYFRLKFCLGFCYYSHVLLDFFQVIQILFEGALYRQHQLQINLRYLFVGIILFLRIIGPL
jgi:hypothetical protein